jgi:predicted O-linked N-acetylglucosamine transferase (SPINDLY family)
MTNAVAGRTAVSRAGRSILSNIGLPELIAETPEQYVEIAVSLAHAQPRLAELCSTLRGQMEASPLRDATGHARDIEAAYRQMWRRWCDNCTKDDQSDC